MAFLVRKVKLLDYPKLKKLCLKTLAANPTISAEEKTSQSNLSFFEQWIIGKYKIVLEKDGVIAGFFYGFPPPSQAPKKVEVLAFVVDPSLPDKEIVAGGIELFKYAYSEYLAVGTEIGYGRFWKGISAHKVVEALGLPYKIEGTDPLTNAPKLYSAEFTLSLIMEKINKWQP